MLYSNENYTYFKRRRLLRCVQAAVSRLIDPRQGSSEWKTKKISLLDHLLTEHKYSGTVNDRPGTHFFP